MRKSAANAVLSTPELILLVSAHLTPHNLAQCSLVCKDWSRQFEPILWTDFCLKPHHDETLSDAPLKAALIRNLPHIRTLRSFSVDDTLLQVLTQGSATEPSTFCANLKRLEFEDVEYERLDRISPYLATLLDLNHRLTHLELPFEFLDVGAVSTSMSKLENLKRLSITSTEQCEGNRAISSLLQACLPLPNLTQLLIDLDLIWDDDDQCVPDLKTIIKEAAIVRCSQNPRAIKITSLRLPSNRSGCWNPLPLLLFKSSLLDLQSCEIPWFDEGTNLSKLTKIVRQHCPNLKHLTCPSFGGDEDDGGKAVRAFIRGCTGLQSFVSCYFSDENPDFESRSRSTLSTLVSQHANTLEVFDLTLCHQVYSPDLQGILSRCKRLKRFWVMNSNAYGNYIGIESTDIWREDWVCMELMELGLTIN